MSTQPKMNPAVEVALGAALYLASIWLVWDAYEGRGRLRSFWAGVLLP